MKLSFILIGIFSSYFIVFAQDPSANTFITNAENYFLPSVTDTNSISFKFLPNNFGVDELDKVELFYIGDHFIPHSIHLSNLNNEIYNEFICRATIGYSLGDIIDLGISGVYRNQSIKRFRSINDFGLDLSARIYVGNNIWAGIRGRNLIGFNNIDTLQQRFQSIEMGLSWQASDKLTLAASNTLNLPGRNFFSFNGSYLVNKNIALWFRTWGSEARFSLGVAVNLNGFNLNPNVEYHSKLGFSQSYLIEYLY